MRNPCHVYIMANLWSRVIYVGMTCELEKRIAKHRSNEAEGFVAKYRVTALVYVEELEGPRAAIEREKQIKGYRREKKIALIESQNPDWRDLAAEVATLTNRRIPPSASERTAT